MKKVVIAERENEREILSEYQIMKKLKVNNAIKERIELYRDFVINLVGYVYNSYLGREFIKSDDDVRGHFNWAFNKVLAEYETEGIIFNDTTKLKEFFFKYFCVRIYYKTDHDPLPSLATFIDFWESIFAIKANKEKRLLDDLVDVYRLFEEALSKKIIFDPVL